MSATIENITNNIEIRIQVVREIFNVLNALTTDFTITTYQNELNEINHRYISTTSDILKKYYTCESELDKKKYYNEFVESYHSINLIGNLKKLLQSSKCLLLKHNIADKKDDPIFNKLFEQYENSKIEETYEDVTSNMCSNCNTVYQIEDKDSQFVCKSCGQLEKIYGAVFEDEQFFYQEGQRTKHGKYDPTKHAKAWIERIQARENTEIPANVITAVKKCITRDGIFLDMLKCEDIRGYLKELQFTEYNTHVPLIRKIITGKEPPQLTEHEIQLTYKYFGIVIQIFSMLKPEDKSNCPYIPFFLYKILEQILSAPRQRLRRKEILSCIHVQSRDTLIGNDKHWFKICTYIPEFTKLPTILN